MAINWLKAKKQKSKEMRQQKLTAERAMPAADRAMPGPKVQLLDFDASSVTPPDTRYTEEYQQFLKAQEAVGAPSGEAQ